MGLQQPVVRHVCDAAGSLADLVEVDRTADRRHAGAFPDVPVLLRSHRLLCVLTLDLQLWREPGVVVVVQLDADGVGRRVDDRHAMRLVRLQLRVVGRQYLGAWRADRRRQDAPGPLADGLRLLAPDDGAALEGLDAGRRLVGQAREVERRAVQASDLRLQHLEEATQAQRLDLVLQELMHRLLDRLLDLSGAEDALGLAERSQDQRAGH